MGVAFYVPCVTQLPVLWGTEVGPGSQNLGSCPARLPGEHCSYVRMQVEYEIPDECLHTKLFAKIPHSMEKAATAGGREVQGQLSGHIFAEISRSG